MIEPMSDWTNQACFTDELFARGPNPLSETAPTQSPTKPEKPKFVQIDHVVINIPNLNVNR